MSRDELLNRVTAEPGICGGKPCIRGTRIYVAIILDAFAEGLNAEQILDHYPQLTPDDLRAALAYGAELAQESTWRVSAGA